MKAPGPTTPEKPPRQSPGNLSERFETWSCGAGQPTRHRHDHGNVDHGLVVLGQGLVVADAAAAFADPSKRALYDPPSGQHVEPGQVVAALTISTTRCSTVPAQVTR